ncbi:hypothetical protein SOVF_164350 [Spinacia oleracea]|uniref:Carbon catabolite repressor protein 4 homolog 3 n=1 Tax=Spinacia oleracea TaxID=3562 RepID=A0A9R0HRW9_SPIOL|nr:carbon catabolite repressor protein 4 homolog 3 [Spinacia oleracea]KNA08243.1 hypothetical protein SOVF_164350 [Spinacia oleracea]
MRHSSSFSLHRIAAAFVDAPLTSAVTMSTTTRPPFRGGRGRGRGRRSFSDRPSAVSGEAHFQPARDSNSSLHQSGDFRSINNSNSNSQNYNSPSNSSRGGNNFRGRQQPYTRRHNQQPGVMVQRPKPADYRTWEFPRLPPPPHSERFVVLSYNILADYLANSHRKLYFHIPRRLMSWEWRKSNILFELRLWSPDIMCFQEVDKFHDLEEELRLRGYSGIWKMRTGDPVDGCAIFWRTTRFRLVYEECIEFNKHGLRDNVAQICVLESLITNQSGNLLASSTSQNAPNRVVICNIHVLYNPRRGEMKLGQVRILLERAQAVSRTWDDAPVVLCGDFNCTPMSPLYNFISEQKLDISEVDRDKVSGQDSAVIYPPLRQYSPQPWVQPAGDIASPATVQNTSIDSKQKDSLENKNDLENISEKFQTAVSPQKPPLVDSLQDVPVNSFGNNTDMITDEITSAKFSDQLFNETLIGPQSASVPSTENIIFSGLPLNGQEVKEVPIEFRDNTGDSSYMDNSDILSSVSDNSEKNVVEKEMFQPDNSVLSSPNVVEVSELGAISEPSPASTFEVSDLNTSSASTHGIDVKVIEPSLSEIDENLEGEDFGEDVDESFSDLSNGGDESPPNVVETVDVDTPTYDPSLWTPMEIAAAAGNANSPILEHPLKLRSAYTEVVDSSGTRDSNGEPLVTSYNTCFMGTVDYIWRSEGLCTTKVLAPIPKDAMQRSGGYPTKKWGSDHIALASELAFTRKTK